MVLLHKRKKHFFFRKISYYSNSSTSFQLDNLLLCGDIHPIPGYGSTSAHDNITHVGRKPPTWKHPYGVCSNSVRSNQKGILCDGCCIWHHIKYINMDIRTYIDLGSSDETWYCSNCTFSFNFTDSFFEESTMEDINASLRPSLSGSTHGVRNIFPKVLFLNARSIRNKVFDLQALLLMDSFDVVVIVETWLDRNYQDFELKLEGYNIFWRE